MDEYDEPVNYWPIDFICTDCDSELCINGMCDPMNWPDEDVIEEFILQLFWDIEDDEELTPAYIFKWYWDEV